MKTKWILLAKLMLSSSPSVSSKRNGPTAKIEQAGNTKFHSVEDLKHRFIFQCIILFKCQWWMIISMRGPQKNPVFPFPALLIELQHKTTATSTKWSCTLKRGPKTPSLSPAHLLALGLLKPLLPLSPSAKIFACLFQVLQMEQE